MDIPESFLKLSESDQQKITEAVLQYLKKGGANVLSNDSGANLNDSLNVSNNVPEKPVSKQKTLDSWIVKSKSPPSNYKKVTYSKEIVSIAETGESSRNFDNEEVSSPVHNHQLPSYSSTPLGKSNKPENVIDTSEKQLKVLLYRDDCLQSKQKSPERSKFSSEKNSVSLTEIKSSTKQDHVSENSDQQILTPEKHSPTPARSYNLRSARGVSDDKSGIETSNSLSNVSECEETDKIYKSVHKSITNQKPKVKNCFEKDASQNSSTSFVEVNYDQKTDSFSDKISEGNKKNSECKISSTVFQSELEKTSKVMSVDSNKIINDENRILAESDATLVVKGKRKRTSKSKKASATIAASKSSSIQESDTPEEINVNIKSARSVSDGKSSIEASNSMSSISECVETDKTNKSVHKSVTKQKQKVKNCFEKDANQNCSTSFEKVNYDQNADSFNDKISEENTKNSEGKTSTVVLSKLEKTSKVMSVDSNKITINDENPTITELDVTPVKEKRKKTSKTKKLSAYNAAQSIQESGTCEEINVNIKSTRSVQSKKVIKLNFVNANLSESSIENSVQIHGTVLDTSPSQKQMSPNDIVKSVAKLKVGKTTKIKDKNDLVLYGKTKLDSGVKTKDEKKNFPIKESNSGKDVDFEREVSDKQLESTKNPESQSNEYARETEAMLTNDTNTGTSVNFDSKRTSRKTGSGNKRMVAPRSNLLPDLELASKNNEDTITSIEKSSKTSSQNKAVAKETEELLIKETQSVNSKRIYRRRGNKNKSMVITKNNLLLDLDLTSKNNDKDGIFTETSSFDSSKNSPFQRKEYGKETEELLIKNTNAVMSVNLDKKRISRKRGNENKHMVTTNKTILPDSEQGSINNHKDNIICTGSSSNNSSITKEISTKQTSLINNAPVTEKITLSINQNKCSRSVINQDGDVSHNELNSLNEMKEPPEDASQKSSVISPIVPRSNGNIVLHPKECSKLRSTSKKVNTLKRKTSVQSPVISKKKLKVMENENQLNTSESISDNLGTEIENSGRNFKKCGSKKKATSSKQKVATDSNKDQLDILIMKPKANSSNSNVILEPENKLLKNLKSNDILSQGQKKTTRVKNSKKIKENLSKMKTDSLKSQAVCDINLSENDEIEKLNCDIVGESTVKNKPKKNLVEKAIKKTSIKSTNKGKSIKKTDLGSPSEKPTKHEHSLEIEMELGFSHSTGKSSVVQMDLDSSTEKSHTCGSSMDSEDIVESEKAQENISVTTMDILSNISDSGKDKHIRVMEGSTAKTDDLINNSNNIDTAQTNFKSSVEFDEEMKHNYEAYCKVKETLEAIGMNIEELFENTEMLNSLNSAKPDGVYFVYKCKSDSKISVYMHESKNELNKILSKLKNEYSTDEKN